MMLERFGVRSFCVGGRDSDSTTLFIERKREREKGVCSEGGRRGAGGGGGGVQVREGPHNLRGHF